MGVSPGAPRCFIMAVYSAAVSSMRIRAYQCIMRASGRLREQRYRFPLREGLFTCGGYATFQYIRNRVHEIKCQESLGASPSTYKPVTPPLNEYKPWPESLMQTTLLFLRLAYLFVLFSPAVMLHALNYLFPPAAGSIRRAKWLYVRFALQKAGPAFVKLGQWISTRRDIFLPDVCDTLGNLQTSCYTHAWEHTVQLLEAELGPSWQSYFKEINQDPVGSGCVAQVYKWCLSEEGVLKASLKQDNKRLVAVKVLHPNVCSTVTRDLNIMKLVAFMMDRIYPDFYWISLRECVDEFSSLMEKQVDMRIEANNLQKFQANFRANSGVIFPTVLDWFVRHSILVESFEEGVHIGRLVGDELECHKALAILGINTVLNMLFVHNFVHCDLHPGNILVRQASLDDPQTLVILDCGVTASLSKRDWSIFFDLFNALMKGENDRVADLFLENAEFSNCLNVEEYRGEVNEIVTDAMRQLNLKSVDIGKLLSNLFKVLVKNMIKLESNFTSVILAVMVIEGLGRSLDPDMNILEAARPYLLNKAKSRLLDSIFAN